MTKMGVPSNKQTSSSKTTKSDAHGSLMYICIPSQLAVLGRLDMTLDGLVPSKPRSSTTCRTNWVVPCQHTRPHPKPRCSLVTVTGVMPGRPRHKHHWRQPLGSILILELTELPPSRPNMAKKGAATRWIRRVRSSDMACQRRRTSSLARRRRMRSSPVQCSGEEGKAVAAGGHGRAHTHDRGG
jgi:hypothetical protein